MTQHEKWMKSTEVLDKLYDFFDKGLSEQECNALGRALRAVNTMRDIFDNKLEHER